jgi:aspartyl protease family protein
VQDRDDKWGLEAEADSEEAGVFLPVLRNVILLVAMCLVIAWFVSYLSSGTILNPSERAQQGRQLLATVSPTQPGSQAGGHEMTIPVGAGGHFLVDAMANGGAVRFLIDTGASGILLTQADAQKAGIHPASLSFSDRVQTANGDILVARSNLRQIRIAGLRVDDMEVWVTRSPMPISLLGMSFLSRLASYEARNDGLILRW